MIVRPVIRLWEAPGAVLDDGGCRGGQVGGNLLLEYCAREFFDDPPRAVHAYCASGGRCPFGHSSDQPQAGVY